MTQLYDIEKSLGHLTGLANRLFSNLLVSRFHHAGIRMTAEQWGALLVLINMEGLSQTELAEALYLEKSSVSRLVVGLEKRGWVQRTKDTDDGRKHVLIATPDAKALAARCSEIARSVLRDAETEIAKDELVNTKQLLVKIVTNLRSCNDKTSAPSTET
ncbi:MULTISPECIES: MarR family winged helix-turn-helix transcriptional regulator [Cohaesibacter]|uniref:MarR family winged helix-turn-helix transcriptional regulator n=1 Tax=Cohaesibacter TaxID=655352 RepID=UPI000DEB7EB2|nr:MULTISPECIES: MarR family transcriptional regulator [Cohaesibacter]TLP45032.1 MarR family transcriptional regulator [Cohaesibacter sp. CAU 1516]